MAGFYFLSTPALLWDRPSVLIVARYPDVSLHIFAFSFWRVMFYVVHLYSITIREYNSNGNILFRRFYGFRKQIL